MRSSQPARAKSRWSLSVIVAVALVWHESFTLLLSQSTNIELNKVPPLQIIVLAGQDGVNIIKGKQAVKPVVEVRDQDRNPVAGLPITFIAPTSGPHVTFGRRTSTYSTVTDSGGRASVYVMTPVGVGAFKITVKASSKGYTATASFAQTNYQTLTAAEAARGTVTAGGARGTVIAGGGETAGATGTSSSTAGAAEGTQAANGGREGGTVPRSTAPASKPRAGRGGISKGMVGLIVAGLAGGVVAAVVAGKGGGGSKSGTTTTASGSIGGAGAGGIGAPH
jgi:hypothetical protein